MIETLTFVDPDFLPFIPDFAYFIVAGNRIGSDEPFQNRAFQQVDLPEFPAQPNELPEGFLVFRIRNSGKIDLQEFFVFRPVGWGVEDGVNVVEDIDGSEGAGCGFFFGSEGQG